MSRVHFWQPPLNPSSSPQQHSAARRIRKNDQPGSITSSSATPSPRRSIAFQQLDDAVEAQSLHAAPTNCDDEADGDLPSIDELLAYSHTDIPMVCQGLGDTLPYLEEPALGTGRSQLDPKHSVLRDSAGDGPGTRDRPVVLEDDESDILELEPEAAVVPASVDAGAGPASELSQGPWWDVEDECYVDDNLRPFSPLEQDSLASTCTSARVQPYSHHHSPGPSQDQINGHGDAGIGGALDEPPPHTPPQPVDENGKRGGNENASELERDMQLAFEEQEKSSLDSAPSSPHPQYHSVELSHPQSDSERDQGGTSNVSLELGRDPREDQGEEAHEQRQHKVAAEQSSGGDGELEPKERGEKRRHPDEYNEMDSDRHHPRGSDSSNNTGDEDGDDDEDPPSAKRQRLPSTYNAPTLPDEPVPGAGNDHHTPRPPRTPSATVESVTVAEYQEWPFQGFLKRTKMGNQMIYNLEFQLPCIQKHLCSEASDLRSTNETSVEALARHKASARSRISPSTARRPRIKRVPWTAEEDATVLKRRDEDGCSWEEIHNDLPHRTPGAIQAQYYSIRASSSGFGDSQQEWEVDRILSVRLVDGELKYRVKWTNYDDDLEEYPASNFRNSPLALRIFHDTNPSLPGPPANLGYWITCASKNETSEEREDDNKPQADVSAAEEMARSAPETDVRTTTDLKPMSRRQKRRRGRPPKIRREAGREAVGRG